jgi:hypothetical protein
MHVLRVQPGVVVNFIDPSSSSSRHQHRSWTPRVVEYKSNHRSSHSHAGEDPGDPSWATNHSPRPRSADPVDGRNQLDSFAGYEQPGPHRDPHRSPTTHHFIPDEHFPLPDPYYPEPHYQGPHYSDTHFEPHYQETQRMEPRYPEQQFAVESHESPSHVPSPINIPPHTSTSGGPDYLLHSPSSSVSDFSRFNHGHPTEPYYFDPRQSPVPSEMPSQVSSSPRNRRPSFDFPSPGKPPSPLSSNTRTVRFKDDPVLPSPPARRKGWWNRKGDELWDNDGSYALAPEHRQYPSDLRNYPEPGVGWMNEEGVQIDMKRRLVRKKPLRSALKKSSL